MPRKIPAPRHPEFFIRVVTALRLASGQRQPQNEVERKLLDRVRKRNVTSATAAGLVAKFEAIPLTQRKEILGPLADETALPEASVTRYEGGFSRTATTFELGRNRPGVFERWLGRRNGQGQGSAHTGGAAAETVRDGLRAPTSNENYSTETGDTIKYTVLYKGLYCREETDGPFSDEIFITTAVVTSNQGANFEGEVINHPRNYPTVAYEEVDSGSERLGPVVALWKGNSDYFSLVVTVWEHDYGDPNHYREEIATFVSSAIAVAEEYNEKLGDILKKFEETIVDLINALLGTGDDLLTSETVVFTRAQVEEIAMTQPTLGYTKKVLHRFETIHKASGANYVVCFDIERDPPPPPHVIL